jgi:hypothetical protein
MARERKRWRTGGAALGRLSEGEREEGKIGRTAWWDGSACWAESVRWDKGKKRKNRNLFQN